MRQLYPLASSYSGFTLVEILVTLSILAVIASLASATFDIVENTRLTQATNQFERAYGLARRSAVSLRRTVRLCAAEELVCSEEPSWHTGMIIFEDANSDGEAEEDELLQVLGQLPHNYRLVANNSIHTLKFLADGRVIKANGSLPLGTFTLCPPDYEKKERDSTRDNSRELVINSSGRLRILSRTNNPNC